MAYEYDSSTAPSFISHYPDPATQSAKIGFSFDGGIEGSGSEFGFEKPDSRGV